MSASGRVGVQRVRSPDGTPIGVRRSGSGRPAVFVHGSASDGRCWDAVIADLPPGIEAFVMDRRGRGLSAEDRADAYSMRAEAQDIAAVLEAAGEDAVIVAHSWGARCTLSAIADGARPSAAVLYEPLDSDNPRYDEAALDRLEDLERTAPDDEMLPMFFADVVGVPRDLVDGMPGGAEWTAASEARGTLERECRAWLRERVPYEALGAVPFPMTVLLGTRSPTGMADTARRIVEAAPDAELRPLEGQGHVAHLRRPELITAAIADLLRRI